MKPAERVGLVDHADPVLPVVAQCQLLKVARSTVYYRPAAADPDDLAVMRRIDELHLGISVPWISPDDSGVARRRLGGEPQATSAADGVRGNPPPYLLRGLGIERPNQVWCAD
jgi:putative transposase